MKKIVGFFYVLGFILIVVFFFTKSWLYYLTPQNITSINEIKNKSRVTFTSDITPTGYYETNSNKDKIRYFYLAKIGDDYILFASKDKVNSVENYKILGMVQGLSEEQFEYEFYNNINSKIGNLKEFIISEDTTSTIFINRSILPISLILILGSFMLNYFYKNISVIEIDKVYKSEDISKMTIDEIVRNKKVNLKKSSFIILFFNFISILGVFILIKNYKIEAYIYFGVEIILVILVLSYRSMSKYKKIYRQIFCYTYKEEILYFKNKVNNEIKNNMIIFKDGNENWLCPSALISYNKKLSNLRVYPTNKMLWACQYTYTEKTNKIKIAKYYIKIYMRGYKNPIYINFKYKELATAMMEALIENFNIFAGEDKRLDILRRKNYKAFVKECNNRKYNYYI